jgi:hypothetical protein
MPPRAATGEETDPTGQQPGQLASVAPRPTNSATRVVPLLESFWRDALDTLKRCIESDGPR